MIPAEAVTSWLALNQWGHWAGDVFKRCNKGAHDAHPGDLHKLADDTGSLCKKLSQLK